jgi:SAM-dependent methyltransferase
VHVVEGLDDARSLLLAERDENLCRENFLPSEAVALGLKLEALERPKAEERMKAGRPSGNLPQGSTEGRDLPPPGVFACSTCGQEFAGPVWHCPTCSRHCAMKDRLCPGCGSLAPPDPRGRTTERAAEVVGMGRRTYEKAKQVVEAAKAAPERYASLMAQMDQERNVDRAYKKLRWQQQQERLIAESERVELPDEVDLRIGDFREVLADVPDSSVDLVFCDPPEREVDLGAYGALAELAARVLKPGGSLFCYPDPHSLPAILDLMCRHLRFWWMICVRRRPLSVRLPGTPILVEWRPLLWFVNGDHPTDGTRLPDFVELDRFRGRSKAPGWHEREIPATHCIQRLTRPGQVVLDPCVNDGGTLMAALRLKRTAIGVARDPDRAAMAKARAGGLLRTLKRSRPPWRDAQRPTAAEPTSTR